IERMRRASARGKEEGLEEGILIAQQMLAEAHPRIQGVQVSAPFGKVDLALRVMEEKVGARSEQEPPLAPRTTPHPPPLVPRAGSEYIHRLCTPRRPEEDATCSISSAKS